MKTPKKAKAVAPKIKDLPSTKQSVRGGADQSQNQTAYSQIQTIVSNVMKSDSDTSSAIISNLKN